jgi:hypothetical protein
VGLDVVQDGLLIGDREIGELGVGSGCFEEATGETSSRKSCKIFDSGRDAVGELLVQLWHFFQVFTGNSVVKTGSKVAWHQVVNSNHRHSCALVLGDKATIELEESLAEVLACLGV